MVFKKVFNQGFSFFNQSPKSYLSLRQLSAVLGKSPQFADVLRDFIEKNCLEQVFSTTLSDGIHTIAVPIFKREEATKGVYKGQTVPFLHQSGLMSFVEQNEKELLKLGVSQYNIDKVLNKAPNLQTVYPDENQPVMLLWDIASKFCSSTKTVSAVVEYIKSHLLHETYPVIDAEGQKKEVSMFVILKPARGKSAICLREDAFVFFKEKYENHLRDVAQRLTTENEFLSMRDLCRVLATSDGMDIPLRRLIEQKCLKETFITTDEVGNEQTLPMFEYQQNCSQKSLCIRQKAIREFVMRYQKELSDLGIVNGVQKIVENIQPKPQGVKLFSLSELSDKLYTQNNLVTLLTEKIQEKWKTETVLSRMATGQQQAHFLFTKYYSDSGISYYIREYDVPIFIERHKNWLKSIGISQNTLDDLSGKNQLVEKQDGMSTLRDLIVRLHKSPFELQPLVQEITEKHTNATFFKIDEMGDVHEVPVFVWTKSPKRGGMLHFVNEDAVQQFVFTHQELLQKYGVSEQTILEFLTDNTPKTVDETVITLRNLASSLSVDRDSFVQQITQRHRDMKYTVQLLDGTTQTQPIFEYRQPLRGESVLCIKKDAVLPFAEQYKTEFGISDITIAKLKGGIVRYPKEDDMINMSTFRRLLGKHESREFVEKISAFIQQHCLNDTYTHTEMDGTLSECKIFDYCLSPNGKTALFMRMDGLAAFAEKWAKTLMAEFNIYPSHIQRMLYLKKINPNFAQQEQEAARKREQRRMENKQKTEQFIVQRKLNTIQNG